MPTPSSLRTPIAAPDIAARLRLSATRLARQLRQQSALAVIANHGPLTLGALAEHERVAPPSITKLVTKLECDGLVTRSPDPTDRRICRVAISPQGETLLEESRRRKTAWLTGRISELDPERQRRLADALDVLDELTT